MPIHSLTSATGQLGNVSTTGVVTYTSGSPTRLRRMFAAALKVLDASGLRLQVMDRDNVAGMERVSFSVVATRRAHARILSDLRASDAADQVVAFRDTEDE